MRTRTAVPLAGISHTLWSLRGEEAGATFSGNVPRDYYRTSNKLSLNGHVSSTFVHNFLQISWRLHTKKNWVSCDPFLPLQEQALEVNANHCNLSIEKVFKSIESRKLTENLKNAFCFTFERLREGSASARIKGTSRDVISSRRVSFESRSTRVFLPLSYCVTVHTS